MVTFQKEKQLVRKFLKALDAPFEYAPVNAFKNFTNNNYLWRGYHPFNEIKGGEGVVEQFWNPLRTSLTNLQRRMDIFFAGKNQMDDFQSTWVVSMGHLMGLFDKPWLGIEPTGKVVFLRYCEFHRVENDKIIETAMYFDIPHFMMQAGFNSVPMQTAVHLVQPGPMTHDGLLFNHQPEKTGKVTLALINKMISELGQWNNHLSLEDELRLSWHEDMLWWGPTGIGATYTIKRYAKQHSGPFRAAFSERSVTRHIARLAEGHFGGFFGWPNFSARLTGEFMGFPATHETGEFRVIDIYRRDGNKLAENWVFIDLPHFWKQQGIDILK